CANCQYVEQTVYPDDRSREALKKYNVITIKADLTRSDAPGWPLLKSLNPSGGIPLTAIYPAGKDQPIQLASIYTVNDLLKALEEASRQGDTRTADASPVIPSAARNLRSEQTPDWRFPAS